MKNVKCENDRYVRNITMQTTAEFGSNLMFN